MKKVLKKLGGLAKKTAISLTLVMAMVWVGPALGGLPTPPAPTGVTAGDFIEVMKAYAKKGADALGLILAVALFIVFAWILVGKFNEARTNKAEWGEVAVVAIVGTIVLVMVAYLLNEATKVIT